MKIINLQAENVKKLKAVEIKPNGEIVTIAGKNGAGKTSVLDSIWWALAGTSNIQAQPIRKGEKKARIRLDLGEMVVERKFTESGSTLTVESKDGARYPSPQKMLDALLGELAFDPLTFARMEPKAQFDELRRVAKLEVDIDQMDALNKGDYAKRTDINREAKAKRAQADGIVIGSDKGKLVDETLLIEEMQKAGEQNTEIETRKARRTAAQETANSKKREGAELFEQVAKLREQADAMDAKARTLLNEAGEIEKKIDTAPPLPNPVDVSSLRQKIEATKLTNKEIEARSQAMSRKDAAVAEAVRLETEAKVLTEQMEAREKAKLDAISAAQMPVEGLGFGAGVVTYGDVPFDQCSSAEQLRVSMSIAMAANPKLRVIRITDGSLLDEDSMKAISAMAKGADYQIWVERVDSSGKVGIVIDDGTVVAVNEGDA